jgi:hypothetical protein
MIPHANKANYKKRADAMKSKPQASYLLLDHNNYINYQSSLHSSHRYSKSILLSFEPPAQSTVTARNYRLRISTPPAQAGGFKGYRSVVVAALL